PPCTGREPVAGSSGGRPGPTPDATRAPPAISTRRSADLADHEVDELARDDDRFPDLLAVHVRPYALGLQRARHQLVLRQPGFDLEAVAHAPVYLHDQLERVPLQQ